MDIEKSIRKIDSALAVVREKAIKKLVQGEGGVVGVEIPMHETGGVRRPRWWCKHEGEIKD